MRFMRPLLRGSLIERCAVLAGLFLGGALFGASASLICFVLGAPLLVPPQPVSFGEILATGVLGAYAGGLLGALEGLILAFPLAAVLKRLRGAG